MFDHSKTAIHEKFSYVVLNINFTSDLFNFLIFRNEFKHTKVKA